jgi:hypothetical protein
MIVALAGRRIDAPDAKSKRFPEEAAGIVRRKLKDCFISVKAARLVCSAACGSDLIAIQVAEELNIQKMVVLPFNHDLFRATSVADRPGDWGIYYDNLIGQLKHSDKLIELKYDKDDPEVYLKTNLQILDHAERLAAQFSSGSDKNKDISSVLLALIVWEGKPKDSDDTTYHFMQEAEKRKFKVKEIKIGN